MPTVVLLWVWFCAYLNCAGWVLSAIHELNARGYAGALLIWFIALCVWRKRTSTQFLPHVRRQKIRRRFRRLFPLAFLILAAMAFLGGALYAPNNYDALAYRTPRVLHWLADGRWHWIHTDFNRLNTRGCGFEWVTAPLFLFTGTDRFEFLINTIAFLLLPGRVFSVLTRLGVRPRAAFYWMWLLPTGYCYLLQAGSIANDLFGALCAMTAVEFALRAQQEKKIGDLWTSILAAGLMTAGKAFNILLLLPWAIAALPALRLLLLRPVISALILATAAGASLVPTALLNLHYCGDWTGLAAEQPPIGGHAPFLHIAVNAILLLLHNFAPPVFPFANAWNHFATHLLPSSLTMQKPYSFEPEALSFKMGEMQMEEAAGLGVGLSLLLLPVLYKKISGLRRLSLQNLRAAVGCHEVLVPLGAWAATVVFMAQTGLSCPARYLSPFYVLLIAPLLTGSAAAKLIRDPWWRRAGFAVFLLGGLLLVLSPPRPLWPPVTILRALGAEHSSVSLVKRAWTVYSVYGGRADAFKEVQAILPVEANPLGMVTWDDPEAALCHPFGSRRILHIRCIDPPEATRQRGIKYVLVSSFVLSQHCRIPLDEWLTRNNAEVIQRMSLELRAARGPTDWYLVRLRQ